MDKNTNLSITSSSLSEAGFIPNCKQNANAACENDANVWCGTFVHYSAFTEAANRPCSQAVCLLVRKNLQHFSDVNTSQNIKKWIMYTVHPKSNKTTAKKVHKPIGNCISSQQLFKIVPVDCDTAVGTVQEPLHCLHECCFRNPFQLHCHTTHDVVNRIKFGPLEF